MMKRMGTFMLTCAAILAGVFGILVVGLVGHDLSRRFGAWSPFELPYFDLGLLCCAVFISAWWVAQRSWAVGACWAGPLVLAPVLALQVSHNLSPDSGGSDPAGVANILIQVLLVLLLPMALAWFAGFLGNRRRGLRSPNFPKQGLESDNAPDQTRGQQRP